jgi:hypothetical protein
MRYPLILLVLLSLFISSATGQRRSKQTKPPAASASNIEKLSLGAIVEKHVSNYEISSDGTARESLEVQRRCITDQCIELFTNLKNVFNTDLQKLKVIDAYLVKADGKIVKVPATDIIDRPTAQSEAAPGFSSLRELEIKFSGWRAGDAAYFKIECQTFKPTLDGRYDALEVFPTLIEWKSIEINVSAPEGYELFTDATGLEGGKLADENGRSRWQYKRTNVPKIDIELMGNPFTVSPRFALTTFRNPAELGAAFWEIVKPKTVVTPELQKLADEITKDAKTPGEQASAIYEWTNRNIRYFFIVLDRSGWVPHDANQIIKNGYGDCKDYTVLIHTLLKAKGIESTPVLIRSELGTWFPGVPTMEFFNHAILYIPSLKLFADATVPNTRLGLIPQTIVGRKAILAGEKTGIIEVPKDDPSESQILSDATFSFADNGSVKAQTRNTYVGRTEMLFRPMFGDSTFAKDPSALVRLMLAYFGVDGDGKVVKVGNPHKLGEPFSVEVEVGIEDYTTFVPKGKLTLPIGLNMVSLGAMEQFVTHDARVTSLEVGATTMRENFVIELPAAVKIVTPPKALEFATTSGRFTLKPEIKEGRLHITRELIVLKDSIEPADYPQFKQLIKNVLDGINIEIEYTADPSLLQAKSRERKKAGKPAPPKSTEDLMMEAMGGYGMRSPLKASEVRRLEAKVTANENDVDTRKKLLRHYANYETERTPVVNSALLKHRVWMIKNKPEVGDEEIFGWLPVLLTNESRGVLRETWLAAVSKAPDNSTVRLNAIDFFQTEFPADAEKLTLEGISLHPTEYKYPMTMTKLITAGLKNDSPEAERKAAAKKVVGHGRTALALIKKERTMERDRDRRDLLQVLGPAALVAEEMDSAAAFATELVLDFGQSVDDSEYEDATHIGNTVLGLVEIRRGNIDKARGYLLASIRAPLRKPAGMLYPIKLQLAKELYEKGAKDDVLEFLRLCLELHQFKTEPEDHESEIKSLKLWREQIRKGIKPSFDFLAP